MSFKLKVNTESIRRLEKDSKEFLLQILETKSLQDDISKNVIDDIKFQSRRGRSIPNNAAFKQLSKPWIQTRTRIIKDNGKPTYVSERRSNISLSGQILDSMSSQNKRSAKGLEIEFGFSGTHEPYKVKYLGSWLRKKPGQTRKSVTVTSTRSGTYEIGKRIRNQDLANYLAEQGREFMGIRPQVSVRLRNLVNAEIRRQGIKTGRINK